MRPKLTESDHLDPELLRALAQVARTSKLLVGCDYDGTLSPIVADPALAVPEVGAAPALIDLADLAATDVSLVSGRALRDLAALSQLPPQIMLVGSHGAEFNLNSMANLDSAAVARRSTLLEQCETIVDGVAGAHCETKPSGVAVHVRNANRDDAADVLAELHNLFDEDASIKLTRGKEVLEMSVVHTDKGSAMERIRTESSATAVIFIGDDVTDEYVFERLDHEPHVTVKVGPGQTAARFRVETTKDVVALLNRLAQERVVGLAS